MKHLVNRFLRYVLFCIMIISCNNDINNGLTSLVNIDIEPAGENCTSGGYKLETGIDINEDGVLDPNEVQNSEYICNGNNGLSSLVNIKPEPAGENCNSGGFKIETGIDINENDVLDPDEVQHSEYICHGNDINGLTSLVNIETEPAGENCKSGGYKIETGIDSNENGILDASEVQHSEYICNGNNGLSSLVNIEPEPAGENCNSGGYKIETGIDSNENGILDASEVQHSEYICHGNDINGLTSLVNIETEPAGENCNSGGYKIETGIDSNENGILDPNEVQHSQYICHGNDINGLTSLVNIETEPAGENCNSGGYKIETGIDSNENGILDASEVQHSEYICHGNDINGLTSLVNIETEPAGENCNSGGYKIETGIDSNENGILDASEVQHSEYICHGNDAFITLGETQTGFEAGVIYQAESDGFLSVYYYSPNGGCMTINGFIFSDESENPVTKVGMVGMYPGSICVPIKKNNYWKVTNISYLNVSISWIPIL